MFDEIKFDKFKKAKGIFEIILRVILTCYLPIFISQVSYACSYTVDNILGLVISKFGIFNGLFFSLLGIYVIPRLVNVYDEKLRQKYFENCSDTANFKEKLGFIFHKSYIIEFSIILIIYAITPINSSFDILSQQFIGNILPNEYVFKAIFLPIVLLLNLLSMLSAMSYWDKYERNLEKKELEKQKNKKHRNLFLFLWTVSLPIASFVLVRAVWVLSSVFTLAKSSLKFTVILILIIIFMPIYRNVRALLKRRSFINKLIKLCKKKKYRITPIKKPYASIFSSDKGEDFAVTYCGKRYSCKMICAKMRTMPLFIHPDGKGVFRITRRFLKIELFSYDKEFSFDYEADGKKILIINPTPIDIFTSHGPRVTPIDNGDEVGKYEIYTATAFLNALEKDVIDKDVRK